MTIAYRTKINQRPVGSFPTIINETHTVGITGVFTVTLNEIRLIEVPVQEVPSSVAIPGYSEVLTSPGTNEFKVDYTNGRITFHPSKMGNTVQVTYKGRGSIIDAEDVNELQIPVGVALDEDGEITAHHIKPISISNNLADDFTFPNDVTINGDLDVKGTVTYIESTTLRIDDPIMQINYNQPAQDAGFQVERDTDPPVKIIWNETNDSWQIQDTSGNPIIEAFDTGVVSIPGSISLTGPILLGDGTVGAPSYTFGSDPNTGIYHSGPDQLDISCGATQIMHITGSLIQIWDDVNISLDCYASRFRANNSGSTSICAFSWSGDPNTGINNPVADNLSLQTAGTEAIRIDANQNVGVGISPVAKLHNAGSTVLGLTTATDPGSISVSTVDNQTGIVITTTVAISVTLPTPTNITAGRFFTVLHKDTSTGTLNVDGSNIGVGKGSTFMWDGSAWIPVGAAGGFEVLPSDPPSPVKGDVWLDESTNQFKGYNGTSVIILG